MYRLLVLVIAAVNAYPGGAPPKACQTLLPQHKGFLAQQASSPFEVSAQANGAGYTVSIQSSIGLPLQGLLMQARTPNGEVVGVFEPNTENLQTLDCKRSGDSLTHANSNNKPGINVQWNSNGYEGPVTFNATVLQTFDTFWSGVNSPQIFVTKRETTDGSSTFSASRPVSTTPHYFTEPPKQESATEFDPIYDSCDTKKACFGAPAGCVKNKNCKAMVAVTVYGERYEFELKAQPGASWVGVGLSDDASMGDDSVIECVKEGNVVKTYLSTTKSRAVGLDAIRDRKQDGVQLLQSSLEDGALYCRILRETRLNINGREYDLLRDQYHLLIAAGESIHANKVSYHTLAYLASDQKRALADVSPIKAASKLLLRLHGAFMLTAWIGTASIGILLARYYRQTWVGSSLCGKDLWFAWHRFFMVLTWSLTMSGFVLIFVELRAWSADPNPHAILGLVTTILCFLQPIGAYFRPHPGTSKRPIFNWLHWLGGNTAHIIAIVTIFFAVRLGKAELPEWMDWILVGYVAFHVITHIVLSIMGCASEKSAEKRVNAFPMKNMDGRRSSAYSERISADSPYSAFRKFVLAIYMIVIILIVAALVALIVLAPAEEFWASVKERM